MRANAVNACPGQRRDDMKQEQKIAQHNYVYVTKIQPMWQTGALPREIGYHPLTVEHDDWCDIVAGRRCHCELDIPRTFSLAGQAKHEEEGRCDATSSPADHL